MKFAFILFAFVFSIGAFAQDPCTPANIQNLLTGLPTDFYSRAQANECLKKSAIATEDKNTFAFPIVGGTRYLKKNRNDFFIGKNLLGNYKVVDRTADGNKAMNKSKFIPKACIDPSPSICESKNPPQNFDKDTCTCVDKEKLYCGDKQWSVDKRDKAKVKCDAKEDFSWDNETCECTEERFCGEKKWSRNKKEKAAESCLDKKGFEWNDESCSCSEVKYCAEKQWSLKKLEKEESSCADKKNHVWNPDTCSCDTDTNTTVMCKGKPVDAIKMKAEQVSCEEKSTDKVHYSWDELECKCTKEKITRLCEDGETIGQGKYDRKQKRCLERMAKDDRWSWDEDKCDCIKEEETKEKLCGEKKWSQAKYDRVSKRCKGTWDKEKCECDEDCYEHEEPIIVDNETCTDIVPKLGDVAVDDLGAKICEKAIPDTEKDAMKAACQEKVDQIYKQSPDKEKLTPIEIEIDYTSKGQVICDDKVIAIKSEKEIKRSLPSNIPTTDPNAYTKNDHACPNTLKVAQNKFHPSTISCAKMGEVKAAHEEVVAAASAPFDEFFKQLNITPPISVDEMNKILEKSNFNLEVVGTANRSNNGTGITLDNLALERKKEAERIIKEEMTKKLASMVEGGAYTVPSTLFTNTGGIAQAVGPLNPAASFSSMTGVLNEPGSAALKAKCGTKKTTKDLFDCSVDYFIDDECPALAPALKEKFCDTDSPEDIKKQRDFLKSQTTVDFLKDFKMFQIGVDMKTESKTPVTADIGTIKVKCNAGITTEETTEGTTTITEMLKVTKPGFFRRMSKECREERKILNDKFGRKNVRKAANTRKNPNGIVMKKTTGTSDSDGNVIIPTTVIENNYPKSKGTEE